MGSEAGQLLLSTVAAGKTYRYFCMYLQGMGINSADLYRSDQYYLLQEAKFLSRVEADSCFKFLKAYFQRLKLTTGAF
jgi:hypothetical protein